MSCETTSSVAVLHGGGYAGRELIQLLVRHPYTALTAVTSRTFAGGPVHTAHPSLRGQTDLRYVNPANVDLLAMDALILAAEHGKAAAVVHQLVRAGYDGVIIDLSADFRFADAGEYEKRFNRSHPAPDLVPRFSYGLAEVCAPYGGRFIANPGCFATGIALALRPISQAIGAVTAQVTALTGASGSGTLPKPTTHFPSRDGNVRAYRPLNHQHLPEVLSMLEPGSNVAFVPVSGPWTRGIWGMAYVQLPGSVSMQEVDGWFSAAYPAGRCVRTWSGQLPELHYALGTPYCDIGWTIRDGVLVIVFALDNLLKGAASQAVQNLNLVMGWPETAGLIRGLYA